MFWMFARATNWQSPAANSGILLLSFPFSFFVLSSSNQSYPFYSSPLFPFLLVPTPHSTLIYFCSASAISYFCLPWKPFVYFPSSIDLFCSFNNLLRFFWSNLISAKTILARWRAPCVKIQVCAIVHFFLGNTFSQPFPRVTSWSGLLAAACVLCQWQDCPQIMALWVTRWHADGKNCLQIMAAWRQLRWGKYVARSRCKPHICHLWYLLTRGQRFEAAEERQQPKLSPVLQKFF